MSGEQPESVVTRVWDAGGDTLLVEGTASDLRGPDGSLVLLRARGWHSAMSNHYGPEAHDKHGQRREKAKPRAMTKAERQAYLAGLVREAADTLRAERARHAPLVPLEL